MATSSIRDITEKFVELTQKYIPNPSTTAIDRLIEYAIHRVEKKDVGDYAHHFIAGFNSLFTCQLLIEPMDYTLINKLIECRQHHWVSFPEVQIQPDSVWHHFKGGVYVAQRLERDTDTGGQRVSYQSMTTGCYFSRPIEQWKDIVEWPDGKYRSRFMPESVE